MAPVGWDAQWVMFKCEQDPGGAWMPHAPSGTGPPYLFEVMCRTSRRDDAMSVIAVDDAMRRTIDTIQQAGLDTPF